MLREHAALTSAEPRLIGGLSVASLVDNALTTELETMMESSLDDLVAKAEVDHASADWITEPNLRQIVAWRAIAGRQFEKTALGEEPKNNDWRMWKYFNHITPATTGGETEEQAFDTGKANVVKPWEPDITIEPSSGPESNGPRIS